MIQFRFKKVYNSLTWDKPLIILFELFYTVTFFATAAVVVIVGSANMLFIWPWNQRLYRRLAVYSYWLIISHVVFLCQWWSQMKIVLHVDADIYNDYFGKEHAICIMNHRYEIDYLALVVLSDKLGISGNLKACVKDTVKYVPIVGWCLYLVEYVFLTRSFIHDELTIKKQIHDIADNPVPVWLIFYPEGTRITSRRHLESRQFERERGLRPLRYHLQPRIKGFMAIVPTAKSHFAAIYDTELYIENCSGSVNFLDLFNRKSCVAHMCIRRIPVKDLPDNEIEQKQYLLDLYQNKDAIMHTFFNKRFNFDTTEGSKIIHPIHLKRNPMVIINFLFWSMIFCFPILRTLITAIIWFDLTMFMYFLATYMVACGFRGLLFWTITLHTDIFQCCEFCDKMST